MSAHRHLRYDYVCPADSIVSLMVDPHVLRRRCESNGERQIEVQVEARPDGYDVQVARDRELKIPDFLRTLLRTTHRIHDRTEWRRQASGWRAEFEVQVPGMAGGIQGRIELSEGPASARPSCHLEASFEVQARVAVIGRRIEALVADAFVQTLMRTIQRNADDLGAHASAPSGVLPGPDQPRPC